MESYRAINDRTSDGIDVTLWWRDTEPPTFAVTVEDWKQGRAFAPIPATLENFREVFKHPMPYLANIAIETALPNSPEGQAHMERGAE